MIAHGKVLESVYKYIPMDLLPEEYLPDDYEGPHPGSFTHIIGEALGQGKMTGRLLYSCCPLDILYSVKSLNASAYDVFAMVIFFSVKYVTWITIK